MDDNNNNNANTSLESRSLGGMNNPQQTQNFLTALKQSGAGSNNSFMASNPQPQQQQSQLVDPQTINQNNGQMGTPSYQTIPGSMSQNLNSSLPPYIQETQSQYPVNMGAMGMQSGQQPQQQSINPYTQLPSNQVSNNYTGQGMNPLAQVGNTNNVQSQTNLGQYTINPNISQVQMTNPYAQQSQNVFNPYTQQTSFNNYGAAYNPYAYNGQYLSPLTQMSDETQKENVKDADGKVYQFLNSIKAHQYEYKDKKFGEGKFISPMAQELEKTEAGKSAVINTPEGKMVNYGRLSGITLASMAVINEDNKALKRENEDLKMRMQRIESQFKLKRAK